MDFNTLPGQRDPASTQCELMQPGMARGLSSIIAADEEPPSDNSKFRKRDMISKEEWEILKPVIKRMYTNENRTTKDISQYLGEHHNFAPTKRQLLRKISDWGYEKNTKREERQKLIAAVAEGSHNVGDNIRGRKLDAAKIQRWKRQGKLRSGVSDEASEEDTADTMTQGSVLNLSIRRRESLTTGPNGFQKFNVVDTQPVSKAIETNLRERDLGTQDKCSNDTNVFQCVDVVNSPRLTGLIGALAIEECADLSLLDSLDAGSQTVEEIEAEDQLNSLMLGVDIQGKCPETTSIIRSKQNPEFEDLITILRTQKPKFLEVYPFPNPSSKSGTPRLWRDTLSHAKGLLTESQCLQKCRRMRLCKKPDTRFLSSMWNIADKYYNSCNFQAAESWYRRLVSYKQHYRTFRQQETLSACYFVIDSTHLQERIADAHSLNIDFHKKVMRIVKVDSALAFLSTMTLASLLRSFDRYEEEECILRQLVQISLVTNGMRCRTTLQVISKLAVCLASRKDYAESETLQHSTIKINLDDGGKTDVRNAEDSLWTMVRLGEVFRDQGKLVEAKSIVEVALERHALVPGIRNWHIIGFDLRFELCLINHDQGKLEECEIGVRKLLMGEAKATAAQKAGAKELLADVLRDQSLYEEATKYYEMAAREYEKLVGLGHSWSMYSVEQSGLCYVRQRKLREAEAYFRGVLEGLRGETRKDYKSDTACRQVELWISAVERMQHQEA